MKMVNGPSGFFIKIKPWVETVNDDFFIVKPDKIITMTEVKDENLIKLYTSYLENNDDEEIVNDFDDFNPRKKGRSSGKVKPSEKMGYISSVKDARKKLEEIFKLEVEDSKES